MTITEFEEYLTSIAPVIKPEHYLEVGMILDTTGFFEPNRVDRWESVKQDIGAVIKEKVVFTNELRHALKIANELHNAELVYLLEQIRQKYKNNLEQDGVYPDL